MDNFIKEYLHRLRKVENDQHIADLYGWFWENQEGVAQTAQQINNALSLHGKDALQPDLPCLTVGSRTGLLILAANPGWKKETNAKEDRYCRESTKQYVDLMFDIFALYPQVVGKRIRWWSNPMGFIGILNDGQSRLGSPKSAKEKWIRVHESKLLGGWELFPFHSGSDGISQHIASQRWLGDCARESILAAIRLRPEVLFVASKSGYELVRRHLLANKDWKDSAIKNGSISTKVSYCVIGKTEIVAIAHQIFSAPRKFTNKEIIRAVNRFRQVRTGG